MTWQWVAAELTTGRVIADLPSFDPEWPLKRTVSSSDDARGVLQLDGAPENWERAVEEGNSILACYDDAPDANGVQSKPVVWAGVVWTIDRVGETDTVEVTLMSTFECMFEAGPNVGDELYTSSQHRDDIIADLVNTYVIGQMGISYLQLDYTTGGGPTPPTMDNPPSTGAAIIMQNTDNATVKQRMDQVFAQLGGEYTVEWAFDATGELLVPTLRFGDRIGQATPAGLEPVVTFEMPGVLTAFTQTRDYSPGKGANKVLPYSSGQGASTPYGTAVTAPADGRPVFEYRYQPASNLSPAALSTYAQQAIKILGPGARPITMTASLSACEEGRRLGVDWRLGDDIGYAVGTSEPIPAFPGGLSGVGRCIGYEFTLTTITPTLADATLYQGA